MTFVFAKAIKKGDRCIVVVVSVCAYYLDMHERVAEGNVVVYPWRHILDPLPVSRQPLILPLTLQKVVPLRLAEAPGSEPNICHVPPWLQYPDSLVTFSLQSVLR